MNIHHLELFYFVAKHGGITAAVRNIPYGIQQPAVSGQIAKLEESLGTKLFQRRPFALSPTGTELFDFIRPFFENIDVVAERLRQNSSPQLRIAAPAIVLHDYLPQILQRVRAKFPAFRLYLHEATRTDAERLLLARDVDLAIMLIDKKSRAGIQVRPLLELPLVLLMHKTSKLTRAEELWKRDKIEETLVCFSRSDPVHAYFQRGLERLGVEWFCGIEVTSERLIQHYVASGYGIGLTVAVPGFNPPPQLRALPLSDFPPVVVGVAWSSKLSHIARHWYQNSTSRQRCNGRVSENADRDPRRLLSVAFGFEHLLDLLSQLRRVLVPVRGDGMLHRRVQHFVFRAGNFNRAILFARVIPAINRFSLRCHR